uniref:Uncharacterized protein n=1 Tax=Glossina austeni TaxID=7395 RepID=A0A1A9UQU4_GLOAU
MEPFQLVTQFRNEITQVDSNIRPKTSFIELRPILNNGASLKINAAFLGGSATNSRLLLTLGDENCAPALLEVENFSGDLIQPQVDVRSQQLVRIWLFNFVLLSV